MDIHQLTHLLERPCGRNRIDALNYDLNIKVQAPIKDDAGVMICCHGLGGDSSIINALDPIDMMLVGFNFPDAGEAVSERDPNETTFGSIDEITPLLHLMKICVIDGEQESLCLYGFSAGGGAIVNTLAVLHHYRFPERLEQLEITPENARKILQAVEKGYVILHAPLKSIDEIIEMQGAKEEFLVYQERYSKNQMLPIDAVKKLDGLKLNILLFFQNPDNRLGNRDDQRYIERLKNANSKGVTEIITGHDGDHVAYPQLLWDAYPSFLQRIL